MTTLISKLRFACFAAGAVLVTGMSLPAAAATLCVNPAGSGGCFNKIQTAVDHAKAYDLIQVTAGTYHEGVVISIPLLLLGAGAGNSIIDATDQQNGVLIDGYSHAGLQFVTVSGFTVENAQDEGILAVSASYVTISNNNVVDNDKNPGLGFSGAAHGCPGQPVYEADETGDCGGAIHLIGVANSTVSRNYVTGNADGLLISDETGPSEDNVVTGNTFINNPLECGIVLASHPRATDYNKTSGFYAHYGVFQNTVTNNTSQGNGVAIGGSGVGLFSDGMGAGRVSDNWISNNKLIGNGIGGVNLHTHVGPSFGLPADNMDNNTITGNYIAKNLADTADTATPGNVGININSGGGGSPVLGTVITFNTITDEDQDIAVNTPAPSTVEIHFNNLLGGKMGVANVCSFDGATSCGGIIDATLNYWGCTQGPGGLGCSTAGEPNIFFAPWISFPLQ